MPYKAVGLHLEISFILNVINLASFPISEIVLYARHPCLNLSSQTILLSVSVTGFCAPLP